MADVKRDNDEQDEFEAVCHELGLEVWNETYPIIERIEADYPDHSAWFMNHQNSMYVLFHQGWTGEELCEVITQHYNSFLADATETAATAH